MREIDLNNAQLLITHALRIAREKSLNPMAVAILDARGSVRALAAEDGTGIQLSMVAIGKANAALSVNLGTRTLAKSAAEMPYYVPGLVQAAGSFVPLPGGVLIRSDAKIIGAVGVCGDTPDNDEAIGVSAIECLNFIADPGQ